MYHAESLHIIHISPYAKAPLLDMAALQLANKVLFWG
jgi:hypothetical protein